LKIQDYNATILLKRIISTETGKHVWQKLVKMSA